MDITFWWSSASLPSKTLRAWSFLRLVRKNRYVVGFVSSGCCLVSLDHHQWQWQALFWTGVSRTGTIQSTLLRHSRRAWEGSKKTRVTSGASFSHSTGGNISGHFREDFLKNLFSGVECIIKCPFWSLTLLVSLSDSYIKIEQEPTNCEWNAASLYRSSLHFTECKIQD